MPTNAHNKTMLRYPGGKSRAIDRILPLIPAGTKTLYSSFFGGGSFELAWLSANPKGRVIARDIFEPVVTFWSQVFAGNGPIIADEAERMLGLDKHEFKELQERLRGAGGTPIQRATWFFVVNRASFSGATLSGGFGGERFTRSSCDRLRDFRPAGDIRIQSGDVFDSIRRRTERFTPDACIFLDPPYWLANGKNKLYGDKGSTHEGFDHKRLARILTKLDGQGVKWVMSYNNATWIHEAYKSFRRDPATWAYGMSSDKEGKELLIRSNNT